MLGFTLLFETNDKKAAAEFATANPHLCTWGQRYRMRVTADGTRQFWQSDKSLADKVPTPDPKRTVRVMATRQRRRLVTQMAVLLGTSGRAAKNGAVLDDNEWLIEVNRIALEVMGL